MKKSMVNFEPCIRKYKSSGYAQVYIRAIKVKIVAACRFSINWASELPVHKGTICGLL